MPLGKGKLSGRGILFYGNAHCHYIRRMVLLAGLWESIRNWDQTILFNINQVLTNSFFDSLMPWLRESTIWLPLYVFFFAFAISNFGKKGWFWLLFFLLTVAACDQVSGLFKSHFHRLRPCNDPFMTEFIKLRLGYCSASFSFTSSHAANHFGLAIFIHNTFKQIKGFKTGWLFIWAASICYAQMYVGIHYPTDILGGMLIGLFFGALIARIFNRFFLFQFPAAKPLLL
jgi:undecaprenyl-diphosphatase